VKYKNDGAAGCMTKAPKVSEKAAVKSADTKRQVSVGSKPPQVQTTTQLVQKPVEIKAATHRSAVSIKKQNSISSSSSEGGFGNRGSYGFTQQWLKNMKAD